MFPFRFTDFEINFQDTVKTNKEFNKNKTDNGRADLGIKHPIYEQLAMLIEFNFKLSVLKGLIQGLSYDLGFENNNIKNYIITSCNIIGNEMGLLSVINKDGKYYLLEKKTL